METSLVRQHLLKETEYPVRYQRSILLKTVSVLFVLLFLFLLLFKPFGTYVPEHRMTYPLICLIHALSPALLIYVYFYCLSYVYEHTSRFQRWTLLKEYSHLAIVFCLMGLSSFLLRSLLYNNPDNWSWRYLGEEIRNCYLSGILFYFLLYFASAYFRSIKAPIVIHETVTDTAFQQERSGITDTELFIKTQVMQDNFSFNPTDLLFAKADGNYIELTLCLNNQVSTDLKRISLKKFEAQLATYPFVFRCHRAYLVNLQQIRKVSGNAQGYTLLLNLTEERIPVSRTQLELFNDRYEKLADAVTG